MKLQKKETKTTQGLLDLQEEREAAIRKFNLFSDVFIRCVMEDLPACQHVLRILTGEQELKLRRVDTEHRFSQLTSHDAVMDTLAEEEDGRLFDVEVQGRDDVDHERRTRFYSSMLDSSFLRKGNTYEQLPEVYVFYICRDDFLQTGQTISEIRKYKGESLKPYNDGSHTVFVNAEVKEDSQVSELMKYFLTADPDDMSQGALSERVRLLKRDRKGMMRVCEVMDELISKYVAYEREAARQAIEEERRAKEEMQKRAEEERVAKEEERRAKEEERRAKEEERKKAARVLFAGGTPLEMIARAYGETVAVVKSWLDSPMAVRDESL